MGYRTATSAPTRKAIAGTLGAGLGEAMSGVYIWAFEAATGLDIPPQVEGYFNIIFVAAVAFIAIFLTPPAADEGVVPTTETR